MQDIDQIIATGSRWTKHGRDRVYFEPSQLIDIFGGHASRQRAYINDADGPEYGQNVIGLCTKIFFDLVAGEWHVQADGAFARDLERCLSVRFEQAEESAEDAQAEEESTEAPAEDPTEEAPAAYEYAPRTGWSNARRTPGAPRTRTTSYTRCTRCGGALDSYDLDVAAIPGVHADCI